MISTDNIAASEAPSQGSSSDAFSGWEKPKSLRGAAIESAADYPIDHLPELLQDAVVEVHTDTQAPIALVAGSALTVTSATTQSYVSVRRDEGLEGPVSLYLLTLAVSGERKSAVDNRFGQALQNWESAQSLLARPVIEQYNAEMRSWKAYDDGVNDSIRKAAKTNKDPTHLTKQLADHALRKPLPPRVPQMLRGDDTPEALILALKRWPCAALISAEAGQIFGGVSMNPDAVMRNLALYNLAWGGEAIRRGRTTQEGAELRGVRLTMGLQVQPAVMQQFMSMSGELVRGIGYFARFLLSYPDSTIGSREYRPPTPGLPAVTTFNQRCAQILSWPVSVDKETGVLQTAMLDLDSTAKGEWIKFYNEVEDQLHRGGEYFDVQDVGSKIAEQAARIAGNFHVFDGADGPIIGSDHMARAIHVARWYLHEQLRIHQFNTASDMIVKAEKLERWLALEFLDKNIQLIEQRTIRIYGPTCIRKRDDFNAAVDVLVLHNRVKVLAGPKMQVAVSPHVLLHYLRTERPHLAVAG